MDWHIITSSKGGIGKTLLTLLLLAYYLENKQEGSVLVLDLNGMNTDSAALLLHRKRRSTVFLKKDKNGQYCLNTTKSDNDELEICKTYSASSCGSDKRETIEYAVGYPRNPYDLHNPQSFANLLINIKNQAPNIQENLGLATPFQHIFVDTNYHFCNIFSQDKNNYAPYQATGGLENESITVWFLWVYRQLEKLTTERENEEAKIVESTAEAIESYLKNNDCYPSEKSTPFKHVFSPNALVTSRVKEGSLTGSLRELFNAMTGQHDYVIPELKILANLPKGNCISFKELVNKLNDAYNAIIDGAKEEPALLFLPVINNAIELFANKQCPENIIPLPVYQTDLRQYTDKDRGDIVKSLRGMKIYKHYFLKLIEKK